LNEKLSSVQEELEQVKTEKKRMIDDQVIWRAKAKNEIIEEIKINKQHVVLPTAPQQTTTNSPPASPIKKLTNVFSKKDDPLQSIKSQQIVHVFEKTLLENMQLQNDLAIAKEELIRLQKEKYLRRLNESQEIKDEKHENHQEKKVIDIEHNKHEEKTIIDPLQDSKKHEQTGTQIHKEDSKLETKHETKQDHIETKQEQNETKQEHDEPKQGHVEKKKNKKT